MKKIRVLFGTTNQTKRDRFQKLFEPLGIEVLSLNDVGIKLTVPETGKAPKDNAVRKARAYFTASGMPTFAIDYGLYIGKFPPERQPGLFVRRIYGNEKEATDQEMLEYYVRELLKVGGESEGEWISAIALAVPDGRVFTKSFKLKTRLTSKVSPISLPGEPLSSLQIDPTLNKYHSEMTPRERAQSLAFDEKGFLRFMKKHINDF